MKYSDGLEALLVPVDSVVLLPGNARRGDVDAIAESLERFGQTKPIVVDADNVILAGNHIAGWGTSLKAAVRVGMVWEGWEIDEEKVAAIVEWWESGGESDSGIV